MEKFKAQVIIEGVKGVKSIDTPLANNWGFINHEKLNIV